MSHEPVVIFYQFKISRMFPRPIFIFFILCITTYYQQSHAHLILFAPVIRCESINFEDAWATSVMPE